MVVFFETMGQQDLTQPDLTVGSGFFSDMNRDVFLKVRHKAFIRVSQMQCKEQIVLDTKQ